MYVNLNLNSYPDPNSYPVINPNFYPVPKLNS